MFLLNYKRLKETLTKHASKANGTRIFRREKEQLFLQKHQHTRSPLIFYLPSEAYSCFLATQDSVTLCISHGLCVIKIVSSYNFASHEPHVPSPPFLREMYPNCILSF
mmetsp:Transcript_61104/g.90646  ORF Transcript_61104/g.90646 Transcript_61104/m.90646 type:complete len:108 (-) Transcript_61104:166-489(-)